MEVVEDLKGERWERFAGRRGDWGKPLVLYLARERSGLTHRQIGEWLGGVNYKTVSKTVERFAASLGQDGQLARVARKALREVSTVET